MTLKFGGSRPNHAFHLTGPAVRDITFLAAGPASELNRSLALVLPVFPVIRALVTFLSPENGGRAKMPGLASGQYMPHVVIQPPDVRKANVIDGNVIVDDYLGVRFLSAPAEILPEQPLDCEMELMYFPRVDYNAVCEGATFTVREGGKVIGFGVVTRRSG